MKVHSSVAKGARVGALVVGLAATSLTAGCWPTCPDPEPFESGDYVIIGLLNGDPRLEDQWLLDTVVGALLTVDREQREATIRYTRDGTTYEVHYLLE